MRLRHCSLVLVIAFSQSAFATGRTPTVGSIEVTHFGRQEGVEFSGGASEYLYAELTDQLRKSGCCREVIGENEEPENSTSGEGLILQGAVIQYARGNPLLAMISPFLGQESVRVEVTIRRKDDNRLIFTQVVGVRSIQISGDQGLVAKLAKKIVRQLRKALGSRPSTSFAAMGRKP